MAYIKNETWVDGFGTTVISAEKLNHIEDGIYEASLGGGSGTFTLVPDETDPTLFSIVDSAVPPINNQTGTTYTPVASDVGKLVTLTNAAAITVILPADADLDVPIGSRIDYGVFGEGMATFVAGTGATVEAAPSAISRAQYSAISALKRAVNTWWVLGDLATP